MPRNRKLTAEQLTALRIEFRTISEQGVPLAQGVKTMRKIAGMNQPEFAAMIKVAPRILMEIERGKANTTIDTLNKIGNPFGLKAGFIRVERGNLPGNTYE